MEGIQSMVIDLANPSGIFFQGQAVAGRVMVTVNNTIEIREIVLEFKGEANVYWEEGKILTRKQKACEKYFEEKIELLPKGEDGLILKPSNQIYPFSFTLPLHVPTSFESDHGYVRHTLTARIKRGKEMDIITECPITVLRLLDLNLSAEAMARPEAKEEILNYLDNSGDITGKLEIGKVGYVPGEEIKPKGELQNNSKNDVLSVRVSLVQDTVYISKTKRSMTERTTLDHFELGVVEKGKKAEITGKPLLVPAVPTTHLELCNIIELHYFVELLAITPSGPSFSLLLPLVIGSIPLKATVDELGEPEPLPDQVPGENDDAIPMFPAPVGLPSGAPKPSYLLSVFGKKPLVKDVDHVKRFINHTSSTTPDLQWAPHYLYYNWNPPKTDYTITKRLVGTSKLGALHSDIPPSLHINLTNNTGIFFHGQVVAGIVYLEMEEDLRLQSFDLELHGEALVHWTEGSLLKTVNTSHETYIDQKIQLVKKGKEEFIFKPGVQEFPFSFVLPPNVPTSYESEHGHVRYLLVARIHHDKSVDILTEYPLTVLRPLDLNEQKDAPKGETIEGMVSFGTKSGSVTGKIEVDKLGYVPGEKISPRGEVVNNSDRDLKSVTVNIVQDATYTAKNQKRFTERRIVEQCVLGTLKMGKSVKLDGNNLVVPPLPPSELELCNIIDLQYYIEILGIPANGPHFNVATPIIVGSFPLESTVHELGFPTVEEQRAEGEEEESTDNAPKTPTYPIPVGLPTNLPKPTYALSVFGMKPLVKDKDHIDTFVDHTKVTTPDLEWAPYYFYYPWNPLKIGFEVKTRHIGTE